MKFNSIVTAIRVNLDLIIRHTLHATIIVNIQNDAQRPQFYVGTTRS